MNRTGRQSRHINEMAPRYEVFCKLLESADPPDLPRRRHRRTYEGDASRKDRIKWELAAAYVGHRMQRHAPQDGAVSVGRVPMRLVKKIA
jgi:hypothetical protein